MLLARLVPDRAGDVLARGRNFAESRVVCGVHNLSAVGSGLLTARCLTYRSSMRWTVFTEVPFGR
jgi:hypothetical protein